MEFKLDDIKNWDSKMSCSPTALAAITGKMPTEIGELLKEAASINGRDISDELRPGYDINDWLKVIKLLGGDWVQAENYEDKPYFERPTINEWMSAGYGPDLELVFCDNGHETGHVFATIERDVVDTYTNGRRTQFRNVPVEYEALRVKRVFIVFISRT